MVAVITSARTIRTSFRKGITSGASEDLYVHAELFLEMKKKETLEREKNTLVYLTLISDSRTAANTLFTSYGRAR
jgi:hypothetical protein